MANGEAGRPSVYTKELSDIICVRIAGGESLRKICREEDMPALSTVLLWAVDDREGFSAQYSRAREAQGYYAGDVIKDWADEAAEGIIEPQQAKVAIDGYKWVAERQAGRVYGSKQQIDQKISGHQTHDHKVEVTGADKLANLLSEYKKEE